MSGILEEVAAERARQDKKWGANRDHSPFFWLTILVEEVGEVAKAILEHDGHGMRKELIQVGAVAVAICEWCDRMEAAK